jgi:hypothetical protein
MSRLFLLSISLAAATSALAARPPLPIAPGHYDNQAQVAKAPGNANAETAIPRVEVTIETTAQPGFSLWRVRVQTDPESSHEQLWAYEARTEYDGSLSLVPYYQCRQNTPDEAAAIYDHAHGWLSLEACELRGEAGKKRIDLVADGVPCAVITINIGPRRALLPMEVKREGAHLQFDFNFSGKRNRIDLIRHDSKESPTP